MTERERKKLLIKFGVESQRLREKYGTMEDTGPLLWDLSFWLNRELSPATKDTINWDHVADKFICMARDEPGFGWVYTQPPKKVDSTWWGGGVRRADTFASYKRGTCDWKDSLVFRPGHEPKGEQNDEN